MVSVVFVLAFTWPDRARLLRLLRSPGFARKTWWVVPLAALAVFLFMEPYWWVLTAVGAEDIPYLESFVLHGWPMWSAFALGALEPAVVEELAFRGYLHGRLAEVMRPREALVVQAAMFSVLHMMPLIFLSHFFLGLVLGWLRTRTGSLVPGMMVHFLWNAWVLFGELPAAGG